MKRFAWFLVLLLAVLQVRAQSDSTALDKKVVRKTGWSLGALPAIAYDTDRGFLYGALANIYHFGDGSRYPDYDHSIYLEWSRTTKGSGINQISYDSERLIPNTRVTAELSYLTENALDFYGFNGFESNFNPDFSDKESTDYLTRIFYRLDRKAFRARADFQINIYDDKLKALVGYTYLDSKLDSVDVNNINDGADEEDKVPTDAGSLYRDYVRAGIIPFDQRNGGANHLFKLGLVWDTRDFQSNPTSGIWAEAFLLADQGADTESYGKLIFNWHHYVPVVRNRITFAYRLSYQPKIWGDVPWYMQPYIYNTVKDRDGLGGGKTLRGILRNRIVGEGMGFANFELRTIPYRTVIAKQNFFIGIVPFVDLGMVTQRATLDYSQLATVRPGADVQPLPAEAEALHLSYGGEAKFVLNDNFIVSFSYGLAASKADGGSGMYIGLNYMF